MAKRAKASRLCHLKRAKSVPQIIIGEIFTAEKLSRRIITFLARYGNYFAQSAKIRLLFFLLDFPPVEKERKIGPKRVRLIEGEITLLRNESTRAWMNWRRCAELSDHAKAFSQASRRVLCSVFPQHIRAHSARRGFALLIQLCKIRLEIYPKNSTLLRRELEYWEGKNEKSKSDFYKIPHSIVAAAAVVELFCVMLIFFLLSQP